MYSMSDRMKNLRLITFLMMTKRVVAQTPPCLTRKQFSELCYKQMTTSGDYLASNLDYISFLEFLAKNYGDSNSSSPEQTFLALDMNFQLPFAANVCSSSGAVGLFDESDCHNGLLKSGQTSDLFGFDLSDQNSLDKLSDMCWSIYKPSIESGWVTPCSESPSTESLFANSDSGVAKNETSKTPVSEANVVNGAETTYVPLRDRGSGPILVAIGAAVGILLVFIGAIFCRSKKEDDEDDLENSAPTEDQK